MWEDKEKCNLTLKPKLLIVDRMTYLLRPENWFPITVLSNNLISEQEMTQSWSGVTSTSITIDPDGAETMIVDVNEATLASIRNPTLRSYAEQYVRIYQDFMQQVREMGIEVEEADDGERVRERIAALGRKGAIVRNDGKSVYVNRISPSCQACQTGVGSLTFSVSLKCHRHCFFCFNPNQEDYEYQREHTRDVVGELDALLASGQKLEHLALTGGEPLLHKKETLSFFQRARQNFPRRLHASVHVRGSS